MYHICTKSSHRKVDVYCMCTINKYWYNAMTARNGSTFVLCALPSAAVSLGCTPPFHIVSERSWLTEKFE